MWICYLISTIPLIIGLILWLIAKKITIAEWIFSFSIGIIITLIIHAISIAGMTTDTETWSGQINQAKYSPAWIEKYKVAIYKTITRTRTVGSGKDRHTETYTEEVFSHYETRYRNHPDEWDATDTLGQTFNINHQTYTEIKNNFGKETSKTGLKSGYHSGAKETYFVTNQNNYIYPTTKTKTWTNRIKACPSVFSFAKVPEQTPIYEYPEPTDGWNNSNRLLGTAKDTITIKEWDQLNSKLGPTNKINLIACGLGPDPQLGQWQEAKWIGGKKNDLVITFGGDPKKPTWVHIFGWSESYQAKSMVESIILEKGLTPETLPLIEKEIQTKYQIKDWSKFDYLTIEPPTWTYVTQIIIMLLTQGGVWAWAWFNAYEKKTTIIGSLFHNNAR